MPSCFAGIKVSPENETNCHSGNAVFLHCRSDRLVHSALDSLLLVIGGVVDACNRAHGKENCCYRGFHSQISVSFYRVVHAISSVLSKYRVPGWDGYANGYLKSGPYPYSPTALEDAQRTVGLVRFHAAEWHIDPHKIGVLGFSAGGHLVAAMSTYFEHRLYPDVDAADKESCRPDFAVALHGHSCSRG